LAWPQKQSKLLTAIRSNWFCHSFCQFLALRLSEARNGGAAMGVRVGGAVMFATVWQRYKARQANSFIVAQLSVYCCLFLVSIRIFAFFFLLFSVATAQKMHIENCANKSGENAVNFPLCCAVFGLLVIGKLCLMLPFVLPHLVAVATSTSTNSPRTSQCPASKIDTLSDEVWLMWPG